MILFGESDGIAHHYWKYMDRDSPLFEEHSLKLGDSILKVYQELDRQTAELIELLPEDANVLMMSDHGFGGIGDWLLYPNCWLREQGFPALSRRCRSLAVASAGVGQAAGRGAASGLVQARALPA